MIALVTSELMLFAGVLGMYIVNPRRIRWATRDQPRLPDLRHDA